MTLLPDAIEDSRYFDDIDEYVALCEHYKEEPRTKVNKMGMEMIDPYCDHADKLYKRYNNPRRRKYKKRK